MADRYKSSKHRYSAPIDPDRCAAAVWAGYSPHQCLRKAKKDGWCGQHHPDAEASRLERVMERYRKKIEDQERSRFRAAQRSVAAHYGLTVEAMDAILSEVNKDLDIPNPQD